MELAVLVLRDLLAYSCQLPELARDIGTNHVLGLLTSLLALKPEVRSPLFCSLLGGLSGGGGGQSC